MDLRPAEGENAAFLARNGVHVTAVDFSPVQVNRARSFWADLPGLEFVHAEACAFLRDDLRRRDAIYSTWGAVRDLPPCGQVGHSRWGSEPPKSGLV
ncbi:hypothetical protein ACIA6D_42840 [Streptomyces cacaoi]